MDLIMSPLWITLMQCDPLSQCLSVPCCWPRLQVRGLAFAQCLPTPCRRWTAHLKATLVEVNYGPGESSEPHTHPCPVIVYVLEGSLRTQVTGQPEAINKAGQP